MSRSYKRTLAATSPALGVRVILRGTRPQDGENGRETPAMSFCGGDGDTTALTSGRPSRIAKRALNKVIGRGIVKRLFFR